MAASISSFSHRRYKISLFFLQRNWSPSVFISRSISFSVIHVNVDIEMKSKERAGICCSRPFISKRPGSYAIYRRNALVLEMQNFIPSYMKGWTYLRTYPVRTIFSEPKFLGCIDYLIFLPMVVRSARFARARAPLKTAELKIRIKSFTNYCLCNRACKHHLEHKVADQPLRWLDIVFQGQYLPSLSVNCVAINKDLEKLTPRLY